MKSKHPCLPVGLLLFCTLTAHRLAAQTLSFSPTSIGSIAHNYVSGMGSGDDSQSFTFGTPSVDLVNYNTILVSVSAPVGEDWNIAYNGEGLSSASLYFTLNYNNSFSQPWASVTSGSLQFTYVNGGAASLNNFNNNTYAMPDSGDRFNLSLGYDVVGDLSFTSFTAAITYDNSTLAAAALTAFYDSSLTYQYQPSNFNAPDPGSLLTLQAVPEPPGLTLVGVGLMGALAWVRRRAGNLR